MIRPRKQSDAEAARTRILWATNKPTETTAAPAYVPDPPALWIVSLALLAALVIQSSKLAPLITIRGAEPSLALLVVAWYAIRTGSLRGLAFGLVAGAGEDALVGSTGVAWTFATGFAGLLAGRISRTWLADTKIVLVPFAGAITLVRYVIFFTIMEVQGRALALPFVHFRTILWQSVLDAAVAFVVLMAVPRLGGSDAHRR